MNNQVAKKQNYLFKNGIRPASSIKLSNLNEKSIIEKHIIKINII